MFGRYSRKAFWFLCFHLAIAAAGFGQVRGYSRLDIFPGSYGWLADLNSSSPSADSSADAKTQYTAPESPKPNFQMASAIREAMVFTGIMHGFRYATQDETRSAAYGPFIPNYFQSVSELRGWDDSDTFYTSYILHPMEGSVFGYIQVQNDPRYKTAEFGSDRDYWISRLRAMAFAAALSIQWTMGPLSEASLGNVQLHDSPGFVDIVGTPTMGTLWMVGEDVLDRYAVIGVENRTSNPVLLMLARSCFAPTRAFANMMAWKAPWYRETRPGIFRSNRALRQQLLDDYHAGLTDAPFGVYKRPPSDTQDNYPLAAPIEITASSHYETFLGGGSCIGGGGSGAVRLDNSWQIVAEANGCLVMHMPERNQSGDSEMFAAGPRWTPLATHRVSPYVQVLAGGRRITHEIDDLTKEAELNSEWLEDTIDRPLRSAWAVEHQSTGVALSAGTGVDVLLTRALAWRVADLEYTHSWISNADQIHANDGLRIATEFVLRIGTW
jgi:hypothetical protein